MKTEKKKNSKLIIFVIVIIIMLLVVALVINYKGLFESDENLDIESGEQVEIENEKASGDEYIYLQGTKKVGNVEFSNIRIKKITGNKCEFLADVENLTDEYLKPQDVTIKVIDSSKEVDEIFAGILTELAPYEPNRFKTQVLSDITDAIDVEIEVEER